jgi:hypothetical protein
MRGMATVVLALAAAGCSSMEAAYERGASVADAGSFEFKDIGIEEAFRRKEQIRFPARVAVWGIERNRHGAFADGKVVELERALAAEEGLFSEVLPIPRFLAERNCSADALRQSAALAHADVLLLYEQRLAVDERSDWLRVFNVTVVGAWIVPSTPYEMRLETWAALLDVRNGVVYTMLHDDRVASGSFPSATAGERSKEVKAGLRGGAFRTLAADLAARMTKRKDAAAP